MNGLVIAPILLPLLAGTALLLLRRALPLGVRRGLNLALVGAQVGLALTLLYVVRSGDILVYTLGDWPAPYGIVLVADRLAAGMVLITSLLAWLALLHAVQGTDAASRHFHSLFQWQLFGLNGAFLTGDLFNLFVFFEILLLASYGLMVHGGGPERIRAGLHFVVLNLAGSALFLFAVGTFYGVLGTLNLADLAVKVVVTPPQDQGPIRAAAFLLFGVFALKAALIPLHLWLPASYAATSAPVAALFAIMTKVGAYCLLRVGTLVFGAEAGSLADLYRPWLIPLGLATLFLGALGVLAATALRHQTAYLVVASVGLIFTALGVGSPDGIAAGLYYLAHTTFATAALFLLADTVAAGRGAWSDRLDPGPMPPQAALLGGLFFVTALLVVGLPPLSGFIGKFLVLRAALAEPGWPWVMGLVLISGWLVLIALARSGSLLFLRAEGRSEAQPATVERLLPVMGLLALGLGLLIWAGPVLELANATANQLLQPGDYVRAVLGPTDEVATR